MEGCSKPCQGEGMGWPFAMDVGRGFLCKYIMQESNWGSRGRVPEVPGRTRRLADFQLYH